MPAIASPATSSSHAVLYLPENDPTPSHEPPKTIVISTLQRHVFECESRQQSLTKKEHDEYMIRLNEAAKAIRETFNAEVLITANNKSRRIEVKPIGPPATTYFGPLTDTIIEEHRIDDDRVFVTVTYEMPDNIRWIFERTKDQNGSAQSKQMMGIIERLLDIETNKCQML